jgi:hypothetical protein
VPAGVDERLDRDAGEPPVIVEDASPVNPGPYQLATGRRGECSLDRDPLESRSYAEPGIMGEFRFQTLAGNFGPGLSFVPIRSARGYGFRTVHAPEPESFVMLREHPLLLSHHIPLHNPPPPASSSPR